MLEFPKKNLFKNSSNAKKVQKAFEKAMKKFS